MPKHEHLLITNVTILKNWRFPGITSNKANALYQCFFFIDLYHKQSINGFKRKCS